MRYSEIVKGKTKQTQPMWNEPEQVKNNAGGYVYSTSDEVMLERFLLLGTEGGTYYVGQDKLTKDNAKNVINLIKKDGVKVAETAFNFIQFRRAPKVDASIFTLALVASYGDQEAKNKVYSLIPKLKTATQLFMFVANVNDMRGWSRGLRKAVANWYTTRTDENLSYQLVKYRNREGFTHRDVLRLCHAKPISETQTEMFKWVVGKEFNSKLLPEIITAHIYAMTTNDLKLLAITIKEYELTHEMIDNSKLNDPIVLDALLDNMPDTALLRNLNRFASANMTNSNTSKTTKVINEKLAKVKGVHPINVLNTLNTYSNGQGFKGSKTWTPNSSIVSSLDDLLTNSFKDVPVTKKDILVAVDISGSMSAAPIANMSMNAAQAATAMALTLVKNEPYVDLIAFHTAVIKTNLNKNTTYKQAIKDFPNGGGTDCSAPIRYAIQNKLRYDAIVIFTDNETWAGKSHAIEELRSYRKINPDVKVIEVAMTATNNTLFNMNETNVLRIVGFDSNVPELINKFIGDK